MPRRRRKQQLPAELPLEVRPASLKEMIATSPAPITYPIMGYIGRRGDAVVAFGGLMWRWQRCDMWLEVVDKRLAPPVLVVRWAQRMLRVAQQVGETEVFCLRDAEQPNSAKLLGVVGFQPVAMQRVFYLDGTSADKELWRACLASKP